MIADDVVRTLRSWGVQTVLLVLSPRAQANPPAEVFEQMTIRANRLIDRMLLEAIAKCDEGDPTPEALGHFTAKVLDWVAASWRPRSPDGSKTTS